MRFCTWNVNHRTTQRPIPPSLADAIASLEPDIIVLTEFVPGPSRTSFLQKLAELGLTHQLISAHAQKQNHVLIASRHQLAAGSIVVPPIAPAVPSNALHVSVAGYGFELLGLRIPDYSKQPAIRRKCWDWILATASSVVDRPFILIGDFNTDVRYSSARCGDRISQLVARGWEHVRPPDGFSYRTLRGEGRCIDHAFASRHFVVKKAAYVERNERFHFFGDKGALSDHAPLVFDAVREPNQFKVAVDVPVSRARCERQ